MVVKKTRVNQVKAPAIKKVWMNFRQKSFVAIVLLFAFVWLGVGYHFLFMLLGI
jgi:hypothetical protein